MGDLSFNQRHQWVNSTHEVYWLFFTWAKEGKIDCDHTVACTACPNALDNHLLKLLGFDSIPAMLEDSTGRAERAIRLLSTKDLNRAWIIYKVLEARRHDPS
jgi:hypothetical protein